MGHRQSQHAKKVQHGQREHFDTTQTKQQTPFRMETAFEESLLKFSIPLYQALEKNGNAFMSPYSVFSTLMLLLLGTDGATKAELETVYNVHGFTEDELHVGYNVLQQEITKQFDDGLIVACANRIFSKHGVAVKKTFCTSVKQYYGSEVEILDFKNQKEKSRIKINSWIEEQTKNKIKDLIPPNMLKSETMMVLANAIYFKGHWELKFDEGQTLKRKFYINEIDSVMVDMMSDKKQVMSGESSQLDCKCLQLPFQSDMLSMLILLPKKRTGLKALENRLTLSLLQNAISNTSRQETLIAMPKFRIEASYDFTQPLRKIGIAKIFNSNGDFSRIFEDGGDIMYISNIIHKTFVVVNENGTEAAAATNNLLCDQLTLATKTFEFTADHPFLFLIRVNTSGTILFIGRFVSEI